MVRKAKPRSKKVRSILVVFGRTLAKAIENAKEFLDKLYKITDQGFSPERKMYYVKVSRLR